MHISDQKLPENPSLEIAPDVILRRPRLVPFFGLAVATWADIEGRLEAIFLLLTKDAVALAGLQVLKGWDRRVEYFVKQVRVSNGDHTAIEVRAILNSIARPAKKRNDIAHGIWAICKELPHDLIVMSSTTYTEMAKQTLLAEELGTVKFNLDNREAFKSIRVVTYQNFKILMDELNEARTIIHTFMVEKMPSIVHVHARDSLTSSTIHSDVAKRINNAKASLRKRKGS